MRVLHLHSGNLFGGVETFLLTLVRCRQFSPSVESTFALCFDAEVANRLRTLGMAVSILGPVRLRRPDTVWRARGALSALLKRDRFDVAVCHQAWPLAIFGPVVKSAGIPLVAWMHMAQPQRHWLDRLAGRVQPDSYICNSRFTASTLPATSARVEVIYYPVELNGNDIKAPTAPPSGQVVIIQVSRMEAWKGQRVCIEALTRLRDDPRWVCWQVGGAQRPAEERYLAVLRAEAERGGIADRIRFVGQRFDVANLLMSAHIYCQPNLNPEPFGIAYVEALLAGLPVVASDIGAVPEIVDDTCGVLVRPGDSSALASALQNLVEDGALRIRLGSAGIRRARSLCDPAVQMPRIAQLLQSACELRC